MKTLISLCLLLCILATAAFTQNKPLTNADVIEMIQGGLSESTIVLSIQRSSNTFDTSPKGLIALKKAGATQKVLDAMMGAPGSSAQPIQNSPTPVVPSSTSPPFTHDNPYAKPEPATVFTLKHLVMVDGNKKTPLKQSPQSGARTGTNPLTFVPGFGLFAKGKIAFKFEGARADIRTSNPKVEFEVTVPADVKVEAMIKFVRMQQKDNRREVQIGRSGIIGGSTGFRPEDLVSMAFKEIGTSPLGLVYRATPISTFAPGEYALVNGTTYLDFGIDAGGSVVIPTNPSSSASSKIPASEVPKTNIPDTQQTPIALSDTEVLINAPADKVRTALMLSFTRQKFNLDKDSPNQLVFSKESGGVSGNLAGIFMGKGGRNPRMILTFLIMQTGDGTLVTGKYSYLYPDGQGQGNVKDKDSATVRRQIAAELAKVKSEAER